MDREKLRRLMADPDDDVQLFPLGWKPKESKKPIRHLKALRWRREKRVPKPTWLDKALLMIQEGGAEVNLIQLGNKTSMDNMLASLFTYVQGHQHVVRVELQAREIFRRNESRCRVAGTRNFQKE